MHAPREFLGEGLTLVTVKVGDHHAPTSLGQHAHRRGAKTGTAAGDDETGITDQHA
ncbi:hypothetical protein D3C73_590340 [compost metagenome]